MPVYIDKDRLNPGDFFNKQLALALCRSVCMVMVYTPGYFSYSKTYCAREYKAMCMLEKQRFAAAKIDNPAAGLIIPVIFRGSDTVPNEVKTRYMEDLSEFFLVSPEISHDARYAPKIKDIADYIYKRYREFQKVPAVYDNCADFDFPDEDDIRDWLHTVVPPPLPFPK
jgi:hypothetical protein